MGITRRVSTVRATKASGGKTAIRVTSSRQFGEQGFRVLQVRRVQTLGEPAVNWGENVARLGAATLMRPEAGERGRRPQNFDSCFCANAIASVRHCSAATGRDSGKARSISALRRSSSGSYQRSPVLAAASSAEP
jgi:hypothetical protein